MKEKTNLTEKLNLQYCTLSNRTHSCGLFDLPELTCCTKHYPDFLALYDEKYLYQYTNNTAVCFYSYDNEFDGIHGLDNAIRYNDEKRLAYFKNRFSGVKYVITPEYSVFGDIHRIENIHRTFRSRIAGLWFLFEIGAVVIPNVSCGKLDDLDYVLDGLDTCTVIALSTKGHANSKSERQRMYNKVKIIVDRLPLSAIIVYDDCRNDRPIKEIFSYAIEKGVKIVVPDNTLKQCNLRKGGCS